MSEADNIVSDTTRRLLRDHADPQTFYAVGDASRPSHLWNVLEEAGLTRAWIAEALGGGGASLAEGFEVLKIAGSFALAVPLAETMLASWLLAQAQIAAPDGILTCAPPGRREPVAARRDGTISGRLLAVPFARDATYIAVAAHRGTQILVALLERARCRIARRDNLLGEPRDGVALDNVRPLALAPPHERFDSEHLLWMGAAARSMQIAGGLHSILERSVNYANERVAFERPIGRFQAIQHSLARLAGETAAASAAADSAADAIQSATQFDAGVFLEVASAKIRAGEAATTGCAIAHQVHGAIGFSAEHVLHRYTQRLWAWRDDFGSESEWAVELGRRVAGQGADALWPTLAAR